MAEIADTVTASLVPRIRADIFEKLRDRGLRPPDQAVTAEVLNAYRSGEPHPERVKLGEIISAGWLRLRELDVDELPGVEESKRNETRRKSYRVLADLVLKTVEIAEYHDRIAGNA